MPIQPRPSKRPDRMVACRVTPEQYQQVVKAARAADRNISDYTRDALFATTEATALALEDAYAEGVRAAQAAARQQHELLEAERDRERQRREDAVVEHERAPHRQRREGVGEPPWCSR